METPISHELTQVIGLVTEHQSIASPLLILLAQEPPYSPIIDEVFADLIRSFPVVAGLFVAVLAITQIVKEIGDKD